MHAWIHAYTHAIHAYIQIYTVAKVSLLRFRPSSSLEGSAWSSTAAFRVVGLASVVYQGTYLTDRQFSSSTFIEQMNWRTGTFFSARLIYKLTELLYENDHFMWCHSIYSSYQRVSRLLCCSASSVCLFSIMLSSYKFPPRYMCSQFSRDTGGGWGDSVEEARCGREGDTQWVNQTHGIRTISPRQFAPRKFVPYILPVGNFALPQIQK